MSKYRMCYAYYYRDDYTTLTNDKFFYFTSKKCMWDISYTDRTKMLEEHLFCLGEVTHPNAYTNGIIDFRYIDLTEI